MAQTQQIPFHEQIANQLIEQLEAGTAPWQKPWQAGERMLPHNAKTGKPYRGANALYLMMQQRVDTRWVTFKQAKEAGATVRKGETGTRVQYWIFTTQEPKVDDQGKPVLGSDGKPEMQQVKLERPRVKNYTVFNAEQLDNFPPPPLPGEIEPSWGEEERIERAEAILSNSGANIQYHPHDMAAYIPTQDKIVLPHREQFNSADGFYATALHELGHWTGHASRLNRKLGTRNTELYAREELRAEIASMILGAELQIGHDPGQHAAYVQSWITVLKEDPKEIVRAARDAEQIATHILSYEQTQKMEHGQEMESRIYTDYESIDDAKKAYFERIKVVSSFVKEGIRLNHEENDHEDIFKKNIEIEAHEDQTKVRMDEVIEKRLELIEAATNEKFSYGEDIIEKMKEKRILDEYNQLVSREKEYFAALRSNEDIKYGNNNSIEDSDAGFDDLELSINGLVDARDLLVEKAIEFKNQKKYLNVPFSEKDEVKALGAKWDRQEKSWFIPGGFDEAPFQRWLQDESIQGVAKTERKEESDQKIYLAVPYAEKDQAIKAGAKWDKAAKSWYAEGVLPEALKQFLPDGRVDIASDPAMDVRDEFAAALYSAGCQLDADQRQHPILDGQRHRIPVEGDKKGERSGYYVCHTDGHPAGFIKNYRTNQEVKWVAKGQQLDEATLATLRAQAAQKKNEKEAERQREFRSVADKVGKKLEELSPVSELTPYLVKKQIPLSAAVTSSLKEGYDKTTVIPAYDENGKLWTAQYIDKEGKKRFASGGRKEGCFHPVGGLQSLEKASSLIICEGYATAATIKQACPKAAVVAAFDSGNLGIVAKNLAAKFPGKPMVIAGDDDAHAIMTAGVNVGKEKAEAAAKENGGVVVLPAFPKKEKSWPENIEKFSAEEWRKGMVSDEQKAAYQSYKKLTDFNDMTVSSGLGLSGVQNQISAALVRAEQQAEQQKEQHKIQTLSQTEKIVRKRRQ